MGSARILLVGMCMLLASLQLAPSIIDAGVLPAAPAAAGDIVINELMYDPYWDEATEEWVELANPGASPVNVADWTLSDMDGAVDFVFPDIDFPPGGIALVRICAGTNSTAFVDGVAEFFMGKASGIWPATGDNVLLANATGSTVDFMSYGAWDANDMDTPPADFNYTHSNASAEEGFSLAQVGGVWRQSVPTPLCENGEDLAPALLISEVLYYPYLENEFVVIRNPLSVDADISGWYISDGEGMMAFPEGAFIPAGGCVTVSQNPDVFMSQCGCAPDFECQELNSSIPDMVLLNYVPVLSNEGDEVLLMNRFGTPIDCLAYGDSAYSGAGWSGGPAQALKQGQIATRAFTNGIPADTNTSADWDSIRPYSIGQSDFKAPEFGESGPMTVFASPDSTSGAVSGAIDGASASIWLCVYEFTEPELAWHLAAAARRGLDVRLFLEGAPVGGITEYELHLARTVAEAGGQVRMMVSDSDADIYARYDYVHAKYAVIDHDALLITSENWSPAGMPPAGTTGNRGWGALVEDARLATYFEGVFEDDWNVLMPDSQAFDQYSPLWALADNGTVEPGDPLQPMFGSLRIGSASTVTPVLSPDTSLSEDTVLGMLASATERVMVEEFYIYKHWGSRLDGSVETTPNLYLEAVIDAARRGCEVRVLLDASYYNTDSDDPIDNDDTVAYVNSVAEAEGLDLEAKLVNLGQHGFGKIHNKGVIADDSVLISSINWNLNSVTENRESGVIIGNAEAADYFASIFEYDWIDDTTAPFAYFFAEDEYLVNTTVALNGSASSDNVGITNYTWALDGAVAAYGPDFARFFGECGTHILNLTVSDAWGNSDSFVRAFNVTLTAPEPGDDGSDDGNGTDDGADDGQDGGDGDDDANETAAADDSFDRLVLVLLLLPVLFFIAILAVVAIRRRR